MKYQVQENCLTIYLPREVDHHNAEEIRREADVQTADSRAGQSNRTGAGAGNVSTWKEIFLPDTLTFICRHFLLLQNGLSKGVQSGKTAVKE